MVGWCSMGTFNDPVSDPFWKLTCRKSGRRCGAKHISKSKSPTRRAIPRSTFGSWDVEKVQAVVARSTFPSQDVKSLHVRTTFGRSDVVSCGRGRGLCTLSKVGKTLGFCSSFSYNHRTALHYTATTTTTTTTATLHYTTLHELHYTTEHSARLPLHSTALHYIFLHYVTLTTTTTTTYNYNYNYNYNYIT